MVTRMLIDHEIFADLGYVRKKYQYESRKVVAVKEKMIIFKLTQKIKLENSPSIL